VGKATLDQIYGSLEHPPNNEQQEAIETLEGPLRIIAGPGSGKTHVLVLRTLNLVACKEVAPSQVVVVTFTEKAAAELQDRIRVLSNRLNVRLQLAELNVGTIHWFCGTVLRKYHSELRRYEPLDGLGQQLFVYDNLDQIAGDLRTENKYLGKWRSKAKAVQGLIPWFSKITEETIQSAALQQADDSLLQMLGQAYDRYRGLMIEVGYLDFSSILRELHDLLDTQTDVLRKAQQEYSHFMIDEYQDTNYVQEEILLKLSAPELNIAVVGDDDQSLYRFRGAEVRNILEFPGRLRTLGKEPSEVELTVNYRSHPDVIRTYLGFMEDGDWTADRMSFRTGHPVVEDPDKRFAQYPAGTRLEGPPRKLAEVVRNLIDHMAVEDPSQIALLFHSVSSHAGEVIDELRSHGLQCYAPRAREYLDHPEIRDAVGLLWGLAQFEEDALPEEGPIVETCANAARCLDSLTHRAPVELVNWITTTRKRLLSLQRGEDMRASLLDLIYQAFRFNPFRTHLVDAIASRNLGYFTTLIRAFQQHFRFDVLHAGNRSFLPWRLWASFFYMLHSTGLDDVESDQGPPLGMIQVMTIHQSKGLEFPVVIVGSLERSGRSGKEIDRKLGPFYPRGLFEPPGRVTEFDHRREFYVAFSRAKHLLIAYSDGAPHASFSGLAARLPTVDGLDLGRIARLLPHEPPKVFDEKPLLSLTSHINMYRRCSRQYELFREREFAPSFAAQVFFGTVVHQTIEDIHRHVLDARPEPLTDELVDQFFRRNSDLLRRRGIHPLAPNQRDEARRHVQRYFDANKLLLDRVRDTEVEVTLEQDSYVLNGRIDLIQGEDGQLEMVDFKAQKRLEAGEDFDHYTDQLALYQYLLEERYGERPKRAVLYFTGEDEPAHARVLVDLSAAKIDDVKHRFDETAHQILARDFELRTFPPKDTCRACDFQHYCLRTDRDPDVAVA
jgi:DNA helicase-2/ATP-dependent DNA helicase PcrA